MVNKCGGTPEPPDKPIKPLSHEEQVLHIAMDELLKIMAEHPIRGLDEDFSQMDVDTAIQLILETTSYGLDYAKLNPQIQDLVIAMAKHFILFQRVIIPGYSYLLVDLQAFLRALIEFNDLKIRGLRGSNPLDVSRWATHGPSLRRSLSSKKRVFLNNLSQFRTINFQQ
ncbi:hypothetical protein Lepto7375DRAFT_2609 [Leptolyngbya sp. PCC 7375]|nr:hypothetical protein Lepto7375DRAFT_2609 [Leptolyngbya sp. PCC 7375]